MAPKKNTSQGSKPFSSAQSSSSASKKPAKQGTPSPEPSKKPNLIGEAESAKGTSPSDKSPGKRDIDKFHSPKIGVKGFDGAEEPLADKVLKGKFKHANICTQ